MAEQIIHLVQRPELKDAAAQWFHEKWGVPLAAYEESMDECLRQASAVPQWYLALEDGKIIGGLGVIENDFHDCRDLTPNVCAVYVEKDHRCRGLAGRLLAAVCRDMQARGIRTLYLVTDHTSFYERYGWKFFCTVRNEGEPTTSRLYRHEV